MSRAIKVSDKYLALVKRFPLRPIRNDRELHIASDLFSEICLKGNKRTRDELDYLDVLTQLVADYEAKSPRIQALVAEANALTPRYILQSILDDNGMSQSELARKVGCSQSAISAFLAGKRELSKALITKFSRHFKVSPELFL